MCQQFIKLPFAKRITKNEDTGTAPGPKKPGVWVELTGSSWRMWTSPSMISKQASSRVKISTMQTLHIMKAPQAICT